VAEESMASVASATDYGTGDGNTAHCLCHETAFENYHFLCYNDIKKLFEN
jgi:hypothetical protein